MIWRVEVKGRPGFADALGSSLLADIKDLNILTISQVRVVAVYLLEGDLSRSQAETIASQLLIDPIVEEYSISNKPKLLSFPQKRESISMKMDPRLKHSGMTNEHVVEIAYNPGVMDPTETSTIKGIHDLGISGIDAVRTAKQYHFAGELSPEQLKTITSRILMNKLIQHAVSDPESSFKSLKLGASDAPEFKLRTVDLLAADEGKLMDISSKGQLYLNANEMKAIQAYFKEEDRNPTDVELETIAQTWSEHCHHKTFRGIIRYTEEVDGKKKTVIINNLLKSTIAKATYELKKKWCVSVFHDNAGVIAFDQDYHVCFKVETHNHPSALEPFGGANTGVGGVIRDTLGTGLAAKPLCNTDVFCFAPPQMSDEELPTGTLHPKRVMKGVIAGVRDYGNKMGIPTVNGSIVFDKRFVGNPLVFCGNVGLIPKGKEFKAVNKGDLIVAVGGRTGRDGIHGATFSSGELTSESETVSSGAVQIGNPIEEKKVADVLLKARDLGLYSAITDCGAGGFSSAVGEMGAQTGATVHLDKAPLKYQGLNYHEIWISESQERMVMSVPKRNLNKLLQLFTDENVEAAVLGIFASHDIPDGSGERLQLFYYGNKVCDLSMHFIHEGIPKITKEALYQAPKLNAVAIKPTKDLTQDLCAALSHYNVASKESVIRIYDHEVQGTSVIKPLVGIATDGPSDAAVLRPRLSSNQGIAIANGINIRFGMIDPYWMAASCIDEAIRQIISVGGSLDRLALLDNFCWGNPDKPDRLGGLVRCAKGCYDAAKAFGTPFISGKDSLYNEYMENGKSLAIPGTILISAIGVMDDVRRAVTMDLKRPGHSLYLIGTTADELGGSIYLDNQGQLGSQVPQVDFKRAVKIYRALHDAISQGLVKACHDISEGGLAVTLSEMAFAGGLGLTALLKNAPLTGKLNDTQILFSESNSRFVIEVDPADEAELKTIFKGLPLAKIGTVEDSPEVIVYGQKDQVVINADINHLKEIWKEPLR